ncbi:hypothetical protein SUDANB145_07241 (plasmid) [Streptomyces sp. enrichment culture]|uniref:hypothetical protein n=1 Tax=Streptomyces sp. enrichment culture TaxID=1795815 RepID=UPI003F5507C6
MASKPKKNRSARDKKLARQRSVRDVRKREENPLYYLQPPFEPYQEWIRVPRQASEAFEHPTARYDDRLGSEAKDLADTIVKLGPRYNYMVPMAAVYLDSMIAQGEVPIAVTGQPGYARPMPLKEIAAGVSTQENLDRMREQYPEAGLPETAELMTDDAAAFHLHQLHFHGYMILDNDHVLNLVVQRPERGKPWVLNGNLEEN